MNKGFVLNQKGVCGSMIFFGLISVCSSLHQCKPGVNPGKLNSVKLDFSGTNCVVKVRKVLKYLAELGPLLNIFRKVGMIFLCKLLKCTLKRFNSTLYLHSTFMLRIYYKYSEQKY